MESISRDFQWRWLNIKPEWLITDCVNGINIARFLVTLTQHQTRVTYNRLCKWNQYRAIPSDADSTSTSLITHDALKHHFASLKTDLIFLQPRVLVRKFPWNWLTNRPTWQFFLILKPHQIIFIHYKSRIATAIRGHDNGKIRLEG